MLKFGVVDDYGDDWKDGIIVFTSTSLSVVQDWAEDNNYHSASIVKILIDDLFNELERERIQNE